VLASDLQKGRKCQFSDLVYEVHIDIVRGRCGGLNRNYNCLSYTAGKPTQDISSGEVPSFILIVERGNLFALYANRSTLDTRITDNSYSGGHIGVFAEKRSEARCRDVRVWTF
jgi:hypothetical protein